jgi:carotenoid cleavage dioxygenase-like enzyme
MSDRRGAGRRYRDVDAAGNEGPGHFIDQFVKLDLAHPATSCWSGEGCDPGEPVCVATPGAADEDDGGILSVVLDAKKGGFCLRILDASSVRELARSEVPHHIPLGFHGHDVAETSRPESFRALRRSRIRPPGAGPHRSLDRRPAQGARTAQLKV